MIIILLCSITLFGYIKNKRRDTNILVLSLVAIHIVGLFKLDSYLFFTIAIFILSLSIKFIKSPYIRWSQLTWIIFYTPMFFLCAYDSLFRSNEAWTIFTEFRIEWKDLVYFCTIVLAFAGLAIGGTGGHKIYNNSLPNRSGRQSVISRYTRRN